MIGNPSGVAGRKPVHVSKIGYAPTWDEIASASVNSLPRPSTVTDKSNPTSSFVAPTTSSPLFLGKKYELFHRIMRRNAPGGMTRDKICPFRGETGIRGASPLNSPLQTPEASTINGACSAV